MLGDEYESILEGPVNSVRRPELYAPAETGPDKWDLAIEKMANIRNWGYPKRTNNRETIPYVDLPNTAPANLGLYNI